MWKIIVLSALLFLAESTPIKNEFPPMENPDLFEGDIILDGDNDRNAIVDPDRYWPDGRIPYVITPKLSDQTELIMEAIKHIESNTCIRFVPRKDESSYVKMIKGQGCFSKVGKSPIGVVQYLSLGEGCYFLGSVVHEMVHSIGFYHEQNRSDRDDYVTIHWDNIIVGFENQFEKRKPDENQLLAPYDYESIMHYDSLVFSYDKARNRQTITPKQEGVVLKTTREKLLSPIDILKINKLYKCEKF